MTKVCVVYDIGKTNKKLFVFDKNFNVIHEKDTTLPLTVDEDGDSCEDLMLLTSWISETFEALKQRSEFEIVAVNFSAYGASFVHLDKDKKPVAPLYNYTKSFPYKTRKAFEASHGPLNEILLETASPDLGMLNSGNQLYWIKKEKTEIFKKIKYSLHLPQYCAFVLSGEIENELTSIGCHTMLWDFTKNDFHQWVKDENLQSVMLSPKPANTFKNKDGINFGIGIHDSSAALIPYLNIGKENFILLSTGTWSIALNPFSEDKLDAKKLESDCLNFIRYDGKTVRASRLFSGNEHNRVTKHLSDHFNKPEDYFKKVDYDYKIIQGLRQSGGQHLPQTTEIGKFLDCPFMERNINSFQSYEEAYHQFIMDLIVQQIASMKLTFGKKPPTSIFVDGGFSKNKIFMKLLAEGFIRTKVYSSSLAKASGIGAALVIKDAWFEGNFDESLLNIEAF